MLRRAVGAASAAPRPATTCSSSWPRARAATRAPRWRRSSSPCETATARGDAARRAEDALQRRALRYDKTGDQHYDYISAWIKATRGSDPDAALYYLAVMLEGGEDPRFIVRRMVILASEDIGNADPRALEVAVAAAHAVEHVGLPEGQFALAQAAIYLSLAPKSDGAQEGHRRGARARPRAGRRAAAGLLQSAGYNAAARSGAAWATTTPTTAPATCPTQELLPEDVVGARFYAPDEAEAALRERLEEIRQARGR